MSALSVLAIAMGERDDASVLAIAADLAKRHGSVATIVNGFASPAPMAAATYAGVGSVRATLLQTMSDDDRRVREAIANAAAAQAKRFGLATEAEAAGPAMIVAPRDETTWAALMRELPLADVAIVSQSNASLGGSFGGPLGEALMEARAPVYVARNEASAGGRPAALAWDGSLQSARAARAAIPLLKDASKVAILQNPDEFDASPGAQGDPARLHRYLAARGVAVEATLEVRGRDAGRALLDGAASFGAALLVAGAFGHSRLGEAIFGGATRTMLGAQNGPHLLLSH